MEMLVFLFLERITVQTQIYLLKAALFFFSTVSCFLPKNNGMSTKYLSGEKMLKCEWGEVFL